MFGINWISTQEAAKRLGITQQAVRDLTERGAVTTNRCGRAIYVSEADIEAIAPNYGDITRKWCCIEDIKNEITKEEERCANVLEELKDKKSFYYKLLAHRGAIERGLMNCIRIVGKEAGLRDRDFYVINGILLEGKEPPLIAKELNVHYQTVLNIFHHAFSLLYRCNDNVIDLLKEKVEIEAERARVNNSVLDKKIENVNFSKRLKNICKQHGLITIRDLASLSRTEFSEFDGLGKKCFSEVRDFFNMYYLDFGYIENGREENT